MINKIVHLPFGNEGLESLEAAHKKRKKHNKTHTHTHTHICGLASRVSYNARSPEKSSRENTLISNTHRDSPPFEQESSLSMNSDVSLCLSLITFRAQ